MKIFVQERSGDHNLEIELVGSEEPSVFLTYVRALRDSCGYFVKGDDGKQVFIPWHRIDFIKEQ